MTYVIVDFEATCCNQNSFPREEMEIIEIGAVAMGRKSLRSESEFQSFVRPVRHPWLTDFCRSLTSISQEEVDSAPDFKSVLSNFREWLSTLEDPVFCSWGAYDRVQLHQDCAFHDVEFPFGEDHINLKSMFAKTMGLRRPMGVGGALRKIGVEFEGTPHRGIDDARNIAVLASRVFA